jgi:hypothetical protein
MINIIMKLIPARLICVSAICVAICLLVCFSGCCQPHKQPSAVRALVLTGGHDFDQAPFAEMFNALDNIEPTFATLDPEGRFFDDINGWSYDVIVFYHFNMPISAQSRKNLTQLTENGVGIVVLHHALAGFPDWPAWRKVAGAKYFLADTQEDGVLWKRCTYQHDVALPVHVHDARHPVTAGVADFEILDETYKGYRLENGNHLLLTANHPLSQKEIGWTRTYRNARICSLQSGHGKDAYENPAYRSLLRQAICWCAKR